MRGTRFLLYAGNILDKYLVKIYARAYRDLDSIYAYIAESLSEPDIALRTINELESAFYRLEDFPERGSICRKAAYTGRGFRQLFVKNYCILYQVLDEKREIHILGVWNMRRNF